MSHCSRDALAEAERILADYETAASADRALLAAYPDHPGFALLTGSGEIEGVDQAAVERVLAACGNDALVRLFQIRAERDGSPIAEMGPELLSALDEALAERRHIRFCHHLARALGVDPETLDPRQQNLFLNIVDALDAEGLLGKDPDEAR